MEIITNNGCLHHVKPNLVVGARGEKKEMSEVDKKADRDPCSLLQRAGDCYDNGEFDKAIELYDQVLDVYNPVRDLNVNPYMVKEDRARAYCKVGRFEDAERDLSALLDMIERRTGRSSSSGMMFWLLVARYKGDEKKAMSDYIRM
jgi:tetratricopeptide (TPR) repeat protein